MTALIFLWTRFWILVVVTCNPVPMPGIATEQAQPSGTSMQSTITQFFCRNSDYEGEGCHAATSITEAADWEQYLPQWAKHSGTPPTMGLGPSQQPMQQPYTRVQKRSFKRACRRAVMHGSTWYKGQCLRPQDFPASLVSNVKPPPARQTDRPHRITATPRTPRLKILHWNPGGMSQSTFQELRHWLTYNPVDLVIISETKWTFEACWQDTTWSYIHSPSTAARSGGLLVMVAQRWSKADTIGYHIIHPGRLLHVRIHFDRRATDVIAVYQCTDYRTPETKSLRRTIWSQLSEYVAGLPNRNQLLCGGDFNCSLPCAEPWSGPDTFDWENQRRRGVQHSDMHIFQDLLQSQGLIALNTWQGAGHTYQHGHYASRIDFLLTRQNACDGPAKVVQYLTKAPFVPLNQTHHVPILGTVRKIHMAYHADRTIKACNYAQRIQCRRAQLQDTEQWHQLQDHVQQVLCDRQQMATWPHDEIHKLHLQIIPRFQELFRGLRNQLPKIDYTDFHDDVQAKWKHFHFLKQVRSCKPTLKQIWDVWHHWSRFSLLRRRQQKQARLAKSRRFDELCHQVSRAADRHDAQQMFSIINRFSPRKPMMKLRLRTQTGAIADQYETHSLLTAYVQRNWQGPSTLPKYSDHPPGVPFTVDDIACALSKLHPNKSVAMPYLPAVIWRGNPAMMATYLHSLLNQWWNVYPPVIPQEWKDSWVYFIPKPGKACNRPDQLRPISLMEPLGKLVMGLITNCLKQHLARTLCQGPHFGFLPLRAATDAISRVARHCALIRNLVKNHRRTVAVQMRTPPTGTLMGGLQLFLDLTQAFDRIHRSTLIEHLHKLNTPSDLLSIITHWHEHTQYNLMFQNDTTHIAVGTGLRQGCKIAPILWVVYMHRLIDLLLPLTGERWIQDCLTVYADDIHVGCCFYNPAQLDQHMINIGHLLDCIEALHLQLSYQKSYVILATTGSNQRAAMKQRFKRTTSETFALIPRRAGSKTELPLRTHGVYLGTVMSYHSFELQTWQHRKRAAWSAFARLSQWLRHRQFRLQHRLYLWRTCIHTILTYGLFSTSFTLQTLHQYQLTVYQMLRQVFGNHSYVTGHSHQQVLAVYGHAQPMEILFQLALKSWQRLQTRLSYLHADDFLHRVDWTHLQDTMHLIQTVSTGMPEVPIRPDEDEHQQPQVRYRCPHCMFVTHSIPNLRRHQTAVHHDSQHRTCHRSILDMSLNGKPQCNHCHKHFTTWRRFCIHVERNCCQVTSAPSMPAAPVSDPPARGRSKAEIENYHVTTQPFWPTLKNKVQRQAWQEIADMPEALQYLTHSCMTCGIWNNRCQELHGHYRLHHSDLTQGIFPKSAQITKMMPSTSPCVLCQTPFKRGHTCKVATQLAALALHCLDLTCNQLRCDICAMEFESPAQLHTHLSTAHEVQIHDWNAARDCLPESNGCSHCGQVYATRAGLRRHITDGRCPFFNPMATNTPLNAAAKWDMVLRSGHITKAGLSAHQRLQLSLHCQLCGETYTRCADLSAHLQQTHAQLWTKAGELVRFLLQTLIARTGCICNPTTNDVSHTHICNGIRQLSMIHLTSEQDMLIPWNFKAPDLTLTYSHLTSTAHANMMINALVDRDYRLLWNMPTLLQLFRHRCVLCGIQFHPAALTMHLLAQHHDNSQWAAQIKFELLQCFTREQPNDFHCKFCGLIFNSEPTQDDDPAARKASVQAHFTACCPVLQQISLVLLPIHGRSFDDGPIGHGTDEHVCTPGTTPDESQSVPAFKRRRAAPKEVQKRRASRRRSGAPSAGIDGSGEAHGTGNHTTRSRHPDAAQTDLLRYVRPNRAGQCTEHLDRAGADLEETEDRREGQSTHIENISDEEHHHGTADAPGEDLTELQRQLDLGHGSAARSDFGGRLLAVPTVESQRPGADTVSSTAYGDGQDSQGGSTAHGVAERGGAGHEISQFEASTNCGAMDDRVEHQRTRDVDHPDGVDPVHAMDVDRSILEAALAGDEPSHTAAGAIAGGPEGQEQGEGQADEVLTPHDRNLLRAALANLVLENPHHLCFANAAVTSFLWASLSRSSFSYADWGIPASLFCDMLRSTAPYSIDSQPWYDGLTRDWDDNHGQADSAEFTQMLVQWVSPAFYCSYWHRRWMQCENVLIHDHGDRYQPLFLQLEPTRVTHGMIRLTDMLRSWHGELGMNAGLLRAPECLCVHLERMVQNANGVLYKMQTPVIFTGNIQVPVFQDNTLDCRWEQYQVVSAFAHYGNSTSGHYRALLRTEPGHIGPDATAYWLDCDDGRSPRPSMYIPEGFQSGVTCVWLCRLDLLDLYDWHRSPAAPTATNVLMQMLSDT